MLLFSLFYLGEVSKKFIGAAEVILGTALAGCMFALVSAQPLTIVGHTGPVLVFEEAVFKVGRMFCIIRLGLC